MELRLELRRGGLEAVAFLDAGPFDAAAAVPLATERLRSLGVCTAVAPEALAQALAPLAAPAPPADGVVVARGEPPQQGIRAHVVMHVPIQDTPAEDGVDPFAAYAANVVYPGTELLRKTPASPGIPGKSLLGAPIAASHGTDVSVLAGAGVKSEDDGSAFRSAAYGVALFHRGQLRVADALRVTDDRMEARLTVLPDPRHDAPAQVQKIVDSLAALQVTHGIDREALGRAVEEARTSGRPVPDVVVARGRPPVDGREAHYRLLIDSEKKVGTLREGDRIDFREAETVKNVVHGEALAEVIPAIEPVAGFRIDGNPLRAQLQRATGPRPGENTAPSEDGTRIVAAADGMVVLKGNQFHVVDEYLIQGDVDYRTGNIRASGSVHVRGQVKPGFQVHAGKDVDVLEEVEEAVLEAGGDVKVVGGIMGDSRVIAGGNLAARYLLNSHVEADLDVDVKLSVTNCRVYSKGKVRVLGTPGAILGGEVNAARGLEARAVGSETAKTHVAVGVDLRVLREIEAIDKETAAALEELTSLQSSLGRAFLRDPRAAIEALPPALRKPKLDLLVRMKALYQRNTDLKAQRQMLELENQELKDAQIVVHGDIHAGTTVTVFQGKITLSESQRRVVFYYDREQARIASRRL